MTAARLALSVWGRTLMDSRQGSEIVFFPPNHISASDWHYLIRKLPERSGVFLFLYLLLFLLVLLHFNIQGIGIIGSYLFFFVHGGFDCTCALTWVGSVRLRSHPNSLLVAFVKINPQKQFDVTEQDEALVLKVPLVRKWAAVVFCLDFKLVTSAGGQTPSPSFIDPIWKEKGTKGKTQALNPPTCPPVAPQHLRQSQTLSYMNPCRSLAPCLKRDGTWASQSSILT